MKAETVEKGMRVSFSVGRGVFKGEVTKIGKDGIASIRRDTDKKIIARKAELLTKSRN